MNNGLPFTYLPINDVCLALGKCGHSTLYDKVKKGEVPAPDKIGNRSLWRSDVLAKWLEDNAAKAETEREERAKTARSSAQRMVNARVKHQAQAA